MEKGRPGAEGKKQGHGKMQKQRVTHRGWERQAFQLRQGGKRRLARCVVEERWLGRVVELRGRLGTERVIEPDGVVLFNVGEAAKRVRKSCMVAVEVPQIGAVDRLARKEASGDGAELAGDIVQRHSVGPMKGNTLVGAVIGCADNAEGPTNGIGEFSDNTSGGVALSLDANQHEVSNGVKGNGAAVVDTVAVGLATVGDNFAKSSLGLVNQRMSLLDVGEDGRAGLGLKAGGHFGVGDQLEVERELEFATNSGDAANDVGAVDGAGIP